MWALSLQIFTDMNISNVFSQKTRKLQMGIYFYRKKGEERTGRKEGRKPCMALAAFKISNRQKNYLNDLQNTSDLCQNNLTQRFVPRFVFGPILDKSTCKLKFLIHDMMLSLYPQIYFGISVFCCFQHLAKWTREDIWLSLHKWLQFRKLYIFIFNPEARKCSVFFPTLFCY